MVNIARAVLLLVSLMLLPASGMAFEAPAPMSPGTDPEAEAFLQRLEQGVRDRDAAYLLSIVHEDCAVAYGGFLGPEGFRDYWFGPGHPSGHDVFELLEAALRLGAGKDPSGGLVLPYTALLPLEDKDGVLLAHVLGDGVNVRAWPGMEGRVVGKLNRGPVRLCNIEVPVPVDGLRWVCVLLPEGRRGYIAEQLISRPTDRRFRFAFSEGRWQLVSCAVGE